MFSATSFPPFSAFAGFHRETRQCCMKSLEIVVVNVFVCQDQRCVSKKTSVGPFHKLYAFVSFASQIRTFSNLFSLKNLISHVAHRISCQCRIPETYGVYCSVMYIVFTSIRRSNTYYRNLICHPQFFYCLCFSQD